MTPSTPSSPADRAPIPPLRLHELHGALREEMPPARGSALLLFVLAMAIILYCCFFAEPRDREPKRNPRQAAHRHRAGAAAEDGTMNALDPRQRDQRLIRRLQREMQPATAREKEPGQHASAPLGPVPAGHVRVAAAQVYSRFGEKRRNLERIAVMVQLAARNHVQILALPEAATCGYADPTECRYWCRRPPRLGPAFKVRRRTQQRAGKSVTYFTAENESEHVYLEFHDVRTVAEPVDGPSVKFIAALARKHRMYLTATFIERAGEKFYSAAVLLNDRGETVLHARKRQLWETGDGQWASAGFGPVPSVQTPFGRIGLGFSYDIRRLQELARQRARIVLQCCALYGRDFESIFLGDKFLGAVKHAGFALVIANWTYAYTPEWEGFGMSRIIMPDGKTRRISKQADDKDGLVIADLPLARAPATPARTAAPPPSIRPAPSNKPTRPAGPAP